MVAILEKEGRGHRVVAFVSYSSPVFPGLVFKITFSNPPLYIRN